MVPAKIKCSSCGAEIEVNTYRKFAVCPYCSEKIPFEGFEYREIDWSGSMYSEVRLWTDCPVCRSGNMYLGSNGKVWKCPDCGYSISDRDKNKSVFWFCDECETYLNVQKGFSDKDGVWKCKECGCVNDVSKGNII